MIRSPSLPNTNIALSVRIGWPTDLWIGLAFILLILVMGMAGCSGTPSTSSRGMDHWLAGGGTATGQGGGAGGVMVRAIRGEPVLRVRVIEDARQVKVEGAVRVMVAGGQGVTEADRGQSYAVPMVVRRQGGRYVVSSPGTTVSYAATHLAIEPVQGDDLTVNGVVYPQRMALFATDADQFDAVNYVGIERYLPGVLDREFYRSWHGEAFKAQAVAARSYAIAMAAQSPGNLSGKLAHYDLESTTASQAYGGSSAHAKAVWAVEQTRGQVLAWEGRVVPAYYSSCCGGTGQDAHKAIAGGPNIAPLQGQIRGTWCSASPNYRWGPVSVSRQTLAVRVANWGKANRHPVAQLRGLQRIEITERNRAQRPTEFSLTDDAGRVFTMGPEEFRFACNYGVGASGGLLKSSHVSVRIVGDQVQFVGAGFGHGVGLCQWGAQGLAMQGHDYRAIVGFYYPGAKIEKAY